MNKKLANLTVEKSADYYDSVVKALEKAGFLLVLEYETTNERCYIVAKAESEDNMLKFVEDDNGHIVGAVQVVDDEDGVVDNGMSIDEAITWLNTDDFESKGFTDATSIAIETMHKYQQLQADYENRLKADMVAMLTEIQLEIEELDPSGNEWSDSLDACNEIIQQKINALKGE